MARPPSTLSRPPAHLLARFRIAPEMRRDTIRLYLEKGWSLAVCCRDCPRIVEWTPPDLAARFADRLDTTIANVAERVTCKGGDGCGSRNVAVFPHPYDQAWTWPPERPGDATED